MAALVATILIKLGAKTSGTRVVPGSVSLTMARLVLTILIAAMTSVLTIAIKRLAAAMLRAVVGLERRAVTLEVLGLRTKRRPVRSFLPLLQKLIEFLLQKPHVLLNLLQFFKHFRGSSRCRNFDGNGRDFLFDQFGLAFTGRSFRSSFLRAHFIPRS